MRTFVIYKYTNKLNGKVYVGQTLNLHDRHRRHLANANKPRFISIIDQAIAKYGIDNFTLEVIEYINEPFADEAEAFWIQDLNTMKPNGYNIKPGGSSINGWHHTDAARKRMSESRNKNPFNGPNHPLFGTHWTEAQREKFSITRTGKKIKSRTPEQNKKKSEILTQINKPQLEKKLSDINLNINEIKRLYNEEKYGVRTISKLTGIGRYQIKSILAGKYD